jgi:hypothetical protein
VQLNVPYDTSILTRLKSPSDPEEVTRVVNDFESIQIYTEFQTGPRSAVRGGVSGGGVEAPTLGWRGQSCHGAA